MNVKSVFMSEKIPPQVPNPHLGERMPPLEDLKQVRGTLLNSLEKEIVGETQESEKDTGASLAPAQKPPAILGVVWAGMRMVRTEGGWRWEQPERARAILRELMKKTVERTAIPLVEPRGAQTESDSAVRFLSSPEELAQTIGQTIKKQLKDTHVSVREGVLAFLCEEINWLCDDISRTLQAGREEGEIQRRQQEDYRVLSDLYWSPQPAKVLEEVPQKVFEGVLQGEDGSPERIRKLFDKLGDWIEEDLIQAAQKTISATNVTIPEEFRREVRWLQEVLRCIATEDKKLEEGEGESNKFGPIGVARLEKEGWSLHPQRWDALLEQVWYGEARMSLKSVALTLGAMLGLLVKKELEKPPYERRILKGVESPTEEQDHQKIEEEINRLARMLRNQMEHELWWKWRYSSPKEGEKLKKKKEGAAEAANKENTEKSTSSPSPNQQEI